MPDAKGKLSDDERERVTAFINEKAKNPEDPCLHCGSTDTRVGDNLLLIPAGGVEGGIIAGRAHPVFPVVCHNCGLVRYFHAVRLGLTPLDPEGE